MTAGRRDVRLLRVLVRIEALKAVKRPAFWVTTGVFALFNVLGAVLSGSESSRATFPEAWSAIIQPAINLGPVLMAALTVLLVAPEFRWKTARQNVIDGLGKEQFHWGKVLLLAALVALFFVLPILIGALDVIATPGGGGEAIAEPMDLNYLLGYVMALLLWGTAGLMVAALVRASGPALGLLFLYFLCEQIVGQLIRARWDVQGSVLDFLPARLFSTIADTRLYYPVALARENARRAETGAEAMVLPEVWIPLAAAAAYALLFLALAHVSMRRRDL